MSPVFSLTERATHRYNTWMIIGAMTKLVRDRTQVGDDTRSTLSTAASLPDKSFSA